MTSPVISVENVSMGYRIYERPMDIVKEAIFGSTHSDTFWALRNLSLEVNEGERLGLVGPNGTGKSTLLKIICGNLTPTSGRVTVHGKISSLLSMTPAWNQDETGIENIKYNLLLQGVARTRIPGIIEDIIDFTELGAFIYQPVKTYSTGMGARLSFAIATAIDPEILVIDEVLGAGDGYFAAKASRRMKEFCARGKALLFVSHSTQAVRSMCDTCVWIENGEIRLTGPSETVLGAYEADLIRKDEETNRQGNRARLAKRDGAVSLEDAVAADLVSFRIRPRSGGTLTDTHYVRNIRVTVNGETHDVGLEPQDLRSGDVFATLDSESCEWGRLYGRGAVLTRTLARRVGTRRGGYILAKRGSTPGATIPVAIGFDYDSNVGNEPLSIEILDLEKATWRSLDVKREQRSGQWTRLEFGGELVIPSDTAAAVVKEIAAERDRRPIEITGVSVSIFGKDTVTVREGTPFAITVTLLQHEVVEGINVSVNIYRSDGVYVFYQASCLDHDISGDGQLRSVTFNFETNPFGAGSYELNVYATAPFTLETAPPDEIFDSHLSSRFKILASRSIQFGLVNTTVPVTIDMTEADNSRKAPALATR